MSMVANARLPKDHPLFAPGLKLRPRISGISHRIWLAPVDIVSSGFRPRYVAFSDEMTEQAVAEECRTRWGAVVAWRETRAMRNTVKKIGWRQDHAPPLPDISSYDGGSGVYFLEACGGDRRIKIGHCRDIKDRMNKLGTGCPYPLRLLGFHRGPRALEVYVHWHFRRDREIGEWFTASQEMHRWATDLTAALERTVGASRTSRGTDLRNAEERPVRECL